MANGNQFGQLCHKPSKAATSSSTVPVGRRVEECASVQKQTFSVLPCVLVVETATCRQGLMECMNVTALFPTVIKLFSISLLVCLIK